jgi:hypothetical protein
MESDKKRSMTKIGYVAYRPRYGIFLCIELGCPFWSYMPQGIAEAQVFPDVASARKLLNSQPWGEEMELHRVDIHHTAQTATIQECVKAGLPAWDPTSAVSGVPGDDSGTWGTLDGPPIKYDS